MLHLSLLLWLITALVVPSCVMAMSIPGCQIVADPQYTLKNVQTAQVNVPGSPFAVAYARQKNRAFTSVNQSLIVLDTTTFSPQVLHQIVLPASALNGSAALGLAITENGHYILVSGGPGAIVVDSTKALAGCSDAVVGALKGNLSDGSTATQVVLSKDDEYAFIAQEYGMSGQGNVQVFKLQISDISGSMTGKYIGSIGLGLGVAGIHLSPDGHILYATSELQSRNATQGTLSLLNVTKLKTKPNHALIQAVPAGCNPVRILPSKDGKIVWVTARESNRLLAFDVAKLRSNNPRDSLLASVQVGTSPVGLIFARNETRILTANSNQFNYANATTGLTVVDMQGALKPNAKILLGQVPTGKFPREFALSHDGNTILVTDYGSDQIQAVNVTTLP